MQTFIPKGNIRGFIMPDFVFKDMRLCLGAKMLFAVMCNFAGDKDHCWPSHNTLAKSLDCSVSTVKTYIKQLMEYGYIAMETHHLRSCLYFILQPIMQENRNTSARNLSLRPYSQNLATPRSKSDYKYNLIENNTNTPLPPNASQATETSSLAFVQRGRGDFSSMNKDFEEFFAIYPKKEGKELARSMWFKLVKHGLLPAFDVLKGFLAKVRQSHQWQKDYGRYVPMAVNFLRGKRWEDNIEAVVPSYTQNLSQVQENQEKTTELQKHLAQVEQERYQKEKEKNETLRPLYEAIANKFQHGVNGASFGLWSFLYSKGLAPSVKDIPQNTQGIHFLNWLHGYKRYNSAV